MTIDHQYGYTPNGLLYCLFWKWEGCWEVALTNREGRTLAKKSFYAHPDVPNSVGAAQEAALGWVSRQLAN